MRDNLKATNDHLLVALPERYQRAQAVGTGKIHLLSGTDDMHALMAQIKSGRGELRLETETNKSDNNLNRTAQVLAIPPQLTDQMVLCPASNAKGYHSYADIEPVVEVGDTVYLDKTCLIDENEIMPGIYRVPYSAVICVVVEWKHFDITALPVDGTEAAIRAGAVPYTTTTSLIPVGSYVLLKRVWADDICDYEVDGRMQKVRWNQAETLIAQYDCPPIPDQGIVAWVDCPLKGALNELHPGQRVLLAPGQALVETIAGTSYLCVRHDYILATIHPDTDAA